LQIIYAVLYYFNFETTCLLKKLAKTASSNFISGVGASDGLDPVLVKKVSFGQSEKNYMKSHF